MKVYLAAPYAARDRANSHAAELRAIGITVTSSWLDESHDIDDGTTGAATDLDDDTVAGHAQRDLRDVRAADLLIAITADAAGVSGGSGGRHVETGYALALNKPVVVVGEPENVFHRMGSPVFVVADWHAAVIDLARRFANRDLSAVAR